MCNLHCSSTFVFHQPLQNSLLSLFLHAIQQLQAFLLSNLGYKPFIGSQEPNCGHKRTIWRWSFDLTHNKNRAIIWKIQKLSLLSQFFFRFFWLASLGDLPEELLWGQLFVRLPKFLRWLFIHGCSLSSLFFILVCLPKLSFLHFLFVLAFFLIFSSSHILTDIVFMM